LLLANGADPNLKSEAGTTAASIAGEKNHPNIVELLAKSAK
jgi:ankyrin repeat protein